MNSETNHQKKGREGQIIVTVGREFGSGGHQIAGSLAERLGIQLYDKELINATALRHGYSEEDMRRYDERPVNVLASRHVRDFSNSIEENIAHKTFSFIRSKAEEGESFVMVGRCGEHVLRDFKKLSVFIGGNKADKEKRICELYGVSARKALEMMRRNDKLRKLYHNYYSDINWGDARGYDICINSSFLGVEKTVDAIMKVLELAYPEIAEK